VITASSVVANLKRLRYAKTLPTTVRLRTRILLEALTTVGWFAVALAIPIWLIFAMGDLDLRTDRVRYVLYPQTIDKHRSELVTFPELAFPPSVVAAGCFLLRRRIRKRLGSSD
jgi:hypothetical protein